MFKKLIFNKTLIFILVFTILFNFITIPKKVSAEAITMSYGLYVFLQAAYAAGLTYIVADRVTEDGMKLYQEWQKFNENKPDPPDDDGQRNAIANLLGIGIVDSFGNLVNDVKNFFKSLGAREGENVLFDSVSSVDSPHGFFSINHGYNVESSSVQYGYSLGEIKKYFTFVSSAGSGNSYISANFSNVEFHSSTNSSNPDLLLIYFYVTHNVVGYNKNTNIPFSKSYGPYKKSIYIPKVDFSNDKSPNKDINYYIINNSYILTDDKKDVKKMSPNIDILPKEKLETITTPEGDYQKYIGDDLVDDYIESIPNNFPGDLFEKTPGEFVETDYGIIFVPEGHPIPSPNPNPDPKPDPGPNPDPKPEYPDTFPTDPYPDIVEEDIEIPKGLGKIIALLKELINWSSRIFNKEEIDKDLEPDKPGLFEIPDNLNLDLDPLKNLAIIEKFPFSLPWDLKNAVNLLVSPAEPPKWTVPIVSEEIEIDLSEFESLAFISRSFFTILFIIALVIATRRFIGGA